jgi:hypothetical protein
MLEKIGGDSGVISVTVAEGDLGNAVTSYTYFNMNIEDWRYVTIAFPTVTATTLSLEATTNPSTTAASSASWTDVTTALTGSATATAAGAWIIDTPCSFTRMRVKRLTTNATNALSLIIARSR